MNEPVAKTTPRKLGPGPATRVRRVAFSATAVRIYWAVNVALLAALAAWIMTDARFAEPASRLRTDSAAAAQFQAPIESHDTTLIAHTRILEILLGAATISALGIVAGLFLGPPHQ